jgi:hypothetical protein
MRREGAPRARGEPVAAGHYTCAAAGEPAATAKAVAAACQAGAVAAAGKAVTEARWLAIIWLGTADPRRTGWGKLTGASQGVRRLCDSGRVAEYGDWRRAHAAPAAGGERAA